jgi:hypothetical protein
MNWIIHNNHLFLNGNHQRRAISNWVFIHGQSQLMSLDFKLQCYRHVLETVNRKDCRLIIPDIIQNFSSNDLNLYFCSQVHVRFYDYFLIQITYIIYLLGHQGIDHVNYNLLFTRTLTILIIIYCSPRLCILIIIYYSPRLCILIIIYCSPGLCISTVINHLDFIYKCLHVYNMNVNLITSSSFEVGVVLWAIGRL